MAIPHAAPGELIDVLPYGSDLPERQTTTLVRTDSLQLVRLVLPAGKSIHTHSAPGEITVQCLEGRVDFTTMNKTLPLTAGGLLYLPANEPHALQAVENSSVLVTLLLPRAQ